MWVTMTNGGAPTSTPMSVVAVSQSDSAKVSNLQPFANSGSKNSFIPSMVSVDPANHRVYVMDAGAGKLAGVNLDNGQLSVAWSQDQTTLSFTTLIGPQDQRVLIGTDIPIKVFKQLQSYTTEQVVWRNAQTGAELARSSQFPKNDAGHPGDAWICRAAVLPYRRRKYHRPSSGASPSQRFPDAQSQTVLLGTHARSAGPVGRPPGRGTPDGCDTHG
jgi:hypothetical protein